MNPNNPNDLNQMITQHFSQKPSFPFWSNVIKNPTKCGFPITGRHGMQYGEEDYILSFNNSGFGWLAPNGPIVPIKNDNDFSSMKNLYYNDIIFLIDKLLSIDAENREEFISAFDSEEDVNWDNYDDSFANDAESLKNMLVSTLFFNGWLKLSIVELYKELHVEGGANTIDAKQKEIRKIADDLKLTIKTKIIVEKDQEKEMAKLKKHYIHLF